MRRLLELGAFLILAAVLVGEPVTAQQQGPGAAVTQTGTRADAALRCDSAASGTAVNTLTLQNPGANLANYVSFVGNWAGVSGSVVTATPLGASTTGFTGTSAVFQPVWTATSATLVTGGLGGSGQAYNPPIKANTNTASTITPGPVISGITSTVEACYEPAN